MTKNLQPIKKIKHINNDLLNFLIPAPAEKINLKSHHEMSEFQLQTTKTIIFITKKRNTTITPTLQNLIKKNKIDLRVYNGKKFFNISKRILINKLKFGEYVFTRVNRRHILKVRTQKKAIAAKKK